MKKIIENMPLLLFGIVLLFTNVIGLFLLVWGPIGYWQVSHLFCGVTLPDIHRTDMYKILAVTVLSFLGLGISYVFGREMAKKVKCIREDSEKEVESKFRVFLYILSLCLFGYIIIKIFMFVDLKDITAWLNNNKFYSARSALMSNLGFYEFVLIYSILPMLTGMCYCVGKKKVNSLFIVETVLYIFINIYIFQKRPLIMGLIYIAIVVMLKNISLIEKWNIKKIALIGGISFFALYFIYTLGITLNTMENNASGYLVSVEKADLSDMFDKEEKIEEEVEAVETEHKVFRTYELKNASLSISRFSFTQLMALVGLLNRTSYATIVDIVLYPEYHDYYPIDIGLDMIGIGTPPDENLVAARILQPEAESPGSCPVPFYVTLYTQGGVIVSVIGSILVGFCMGFFWTLSLRKRNTYMILFEGWIAFFALEIAINSGRNALLASDGVIWPTFCLLMMYALFTIVKIILKKKCYRK